MKTRTGGNDGLTVLTTRSRVNRVRYINNMCLSRMWYSSLYTLATSKGFEFEQVLGLCFKSKLRYTLCSLRLTVRTIASQARNALVQLLQGMILTLRNPPRESVKGPGFVRFDGDLGQGFKRVNNFT